MSRSLGAITKAIRTAVDIEPFLAQQIASRITPVLLLDELNGNLGTSAFGLRSCTGATTEAGAAGNLSHSMIFNPAGSGVIASIERAFVRANSAGAMLITETDTLVGDVNLTPAFRDRRLLEAPACTLADGNQVASIGDVLGRVRLANNTNLEIELDFLIPPGQGINLEPTTVQIAFDVWWLWTERKQAPVQP